MNNMERKVNNLIKEVMNLDISKYSFDKFLSQIDEWDSFNNLMLISRIEDEFKIKFTTLDIENADTIGKIFSLIKSKIKE